MNNVKDLATPKLLKRKLKVKNGNLEPKPSVLDEDTSFKGKLKFNLIALCDFSDCLCLLSEHVL